MKKLTGGGKDGGKDHTKGRKNRFDVVQGQGDLPAPLPPVNDPNRPAGIITPHGFMTNRVSYRPVEPTQETLMRADHAEWLHNFALHMAMDTGVPMTTFRQGSITRLHWAYRYIEFLQNRNQSLQKQLFQLQSGTSCSSPLPGSASSSTPDSASDTSGSASDISSTPLEGDKS